jgi:hypothetical protein
VLSQFSVSQKQGEQFFGNSGVRLRAPGVLMAHGGMLSLFAPSAPVHPRTSVCPCTARSCTRTHARTPRAALHQHAGVCGEVHREGAPHRGADLWRRPGQGGAPRRARVLHPAQAPKSEGPAPRPCARVARHRQ